MTKPKMSALVASAIRNLREIRGSTSKEIMNYIKSQYTGSDSNIQKQVINKNFIENGRLTEAVKKRLLIIQETFVVAKVLSGLPDVSDVTEFPSGNDVNGFRV
ncbi:hypothetical protein ALC57_14356 [Trachymyrmex cornetzi]|uniref:H15 domain-containing protein n=1 Tax=Trachymyrmex cornetzi TaxID=471704 RepID=A0A195DKC5_9HYME|nr:hypothetical protein ALC57_14356 [Trachymyrmex cornetzi]